MAGLMVCSTPIFSLLFMGGEFDFAKAVNSAQALLYYALGLSFVAMTRVLAPAFYALKDTRSPVLTAFAAFLINLGFSLALMGPLKHGGLALATTLSALCNMLLLLYLLRRKIGRFGGWGILLCGLKSLAGALPMAVTAWYVCRFADWSLAGHKAWKGLVLTGAVACGVAVYVVCSRMLRSEEALEVMAMIRKRLGRKEA
jgi:putative peptidoglycan lipid II flippase